MPNKLLNKIRKVILKQIDKQLDKYESSLEQEAGPSRRPTRSNTNKREERSPQVPPRALERQDKRINRVSLKINSNGLLCICIPSDWDHQKALSESEFEKLLTKIRQTFSITTEDLSIIRESIPRIFEEQRAKYFEEPKPTKTEPKSLEEYFKTLQPPIQKRRRSQNLNSSITSTASSSSGQISDARQRYEEKAREIKQQFPDTEITQYTSGRIEKYIDSTYSRWCELTGGNDDNWFQFLDYREVCIETFFPEEKSRTNQQQAEEPIPEESFHSATQSPVNLQPTPRRDRRVLHPSLEDTFGSRKDYQPETTDSDSEVEAVTTQESIQVSSSENSEEEQDKKQDFSRLSEEEEKQSQDSPHPSFEEKEEQSEDGSLSSQEEEDHSPPQSPNPSEASTVDLWDDLDLNLLWLYDPEEMARANHTLERDFIAGQRTILHEAVTTQHHARNLTSPEVEAVLLELEELRVRLLANDRQTYSLYTDAADRAAQIVLDTAVKNDLRATLTIAKTIQNAFPVAVPVAAGNQQRIKLPQVELPKFVGGHTEFPTWKDKFDSMVHNNPSLPDIDKLSYLKVSVQGGQGQGIVDQFPTTAGNYINAYNALSAHFEHARTNAYVQIKRLFKIPAVTHASCNSLTDLVNETQAAIQGINGLRAGGLPDAEFRNLVVVHTIRSRLDKSTKKEFDLSLTTNNVPTVQEITDFVKRRAQVLFDDEPEEFQESVENQQDSPLSSEEDEEGEHQKHPKP
jgi:Protein of unknown function (DUF1759)